MPLDTTFAQRQSRLDTAELLTTGSFFAGLALTVIFAVVLAKNDLFAGSGAVAVMFALNCVALVRYLWRPSNAAALLVSKLAIQFTTILSISIAMLGLVLFIGGFAVVRDTNPVAAAVAIGLLTLWSVGCAQQAHRDWVSIEPAVVEGDVAG